MTMALIIAGLFDTMAPAEAAALDLVRANCARENISSFFNSPPGRHDRLAIGGDEHADPKSRDASGTAVTGAALGASVGGVAGAVVAGPVGAVAGAGVGAYVGSLAGGLQGAGDGEIGADGRDDADLRNWPAGVVLAVKVGVPLNPEEIRRSLRNRGARYVIEAEGEWRDGEWVDFDPVEQSGQQGSSPAHPASARLRVMLDTPGQWGVFEGDGEQPLAVFPDREQASRYAGSQAQSRPSAMVEIYAEDGGLETTRRFGHIPSTSAADER